MDTLADARVLITGGAGFVGSHVSRVFAASGADVHVVDNLANGDRGLVPEPATLHAVDVRADALHDVVRNVDPTAIVHLAAHHFIPYCNEHPEETFEVNVMGTRTLLEAARSLDDLRRFVFASTAAVYPIGEGPFAEDDPVGPTDVYGRTKLIGEDLCRLFAAESGVSTAAARLFNIYGRNETNDHVVPAIVDQLEDGNRAIELGNLAPKRDFVHVSDVTRALLAMVTDFEGRYRTFNVGTGSEHSVERLVETAADVLDEEITIDQGEHRVRENDRLHLRADISRLAEALDWEATVSLPVGLRDVLAEAGLVAARPDEVGP